jgi:hypothetical protein
VGALGFGATAAGAQTTTTTTAPPVRSIPVTPAVPAPTSTTVASTSTTSSGAAPLAATGIAADKLVPFGFLLIGMGAVLVSAARRYGRPAYRFL